jgi:hypothetical protein
MAVTITSALPAPLMSFFRERGGFSQVSATNSIATTDVPDNTDKRHNIGYLIRVIGAISG